jgi:hypothetical protein
MFPNWPAVNRGGRITGRAHISSSATGMVASRGPRGASSKWSCIKADISETNFHENPDY